MTLYAVVTLLVAMCVCSSTGEMHLEDELKIEYIPIQTYFDHNNPSNDLLNISVVSISHKGSEKPEHNNQLWLVPGGPGLDAGSLLESAKQTLHLIEDAKLYNIYVVNTRAVEKNSPIKCPPKSTVYECAKHIENEYNDTKDFFTTTQSAHDILFCMKKFLTSGKISIYGSGYGTYVVNLVLHLIAKDTQIKIENVIYDGIIPPDITEFHLHDHHLHEGATSMLVDCVDESLSCRQFYEYSPVLSLNLMWKQLLHGSYNCLSFLGNISAKELRAKWSSLLFSNDVLLLPAVLKRLDRCSNDDVVELKHWLEKYNTQEHEFTNPFMYYHIIFSELFSIGNNSNPKNDHLTFSQYDFEYDDYLAWPKYKPSPTHLRKWAKSNATTLFIHKEYNFHYNLMYSLYAANELSNLQNKVSLVRIPYRPDLKPSNYSCAEKIIAKFLDSGEVMDDPCLVFSSVDFEGDSSFSKELARRAFGVPSFWGNDKVQPGVPEKMTWEGYVLFGTYIVLVVIVAAVFIVLVVKSTKRPDQTRGANYYFNH